MLNSGLTFPGDQRSLILLYRHFMLRSINTLIYLFPYWVSNNPGDDDHFAHFADE